MFNLYIYIFFVLLNSIRKYFLTKSKLYTANKKVIRSDETERKLYPLYSIRTFAKISFFFTNIFFWLWLKSKSNRPHYTRIYEKKERKKNGKIFIKRIEHTTNGICGANYTSSFSSLLLTPFPFPVQLSAARIYCQKYCCRTSISTFSSISKFKSNSSIIRNIDELQEF